MNGQEGPKRHVKMSWLLLQLSLNLQWPDRKKLQMFERILVWNFLKFQRKNSKKKLKYLKIFDLLKNFEWLKNVADKDGFL